jgi:Flp pilus assembly protein TadG
MTKTLRSFWRDRKAASAVAFALFALPALMMVGAAIDYGRATGADAILKSAADAAALSAGQSAMMGSTASAAQRQTIAYNVVAASIGAAQPGSPNAPTPCASTSGNAGNLLIGTTEPLAGAVIAVTETEPLPGTFQVNLVATMCTQIMTFANVQTMSANVTSAAAYTGIGPNQTLEMALALDNTGSMVNDMPNLQSAAKTLVSVVMGAGNGSNVKVSVVPYVAAVNPGITDMTMIDTSAATRFSGSWFTWNSIAYFSNCTLNVGTGATTNSGSSNSGDGADASGLKDLLPPSPPR